MPTPENDPAVGDPVILRGRILKIDAGVALVEVYRSYPAGWTVAVQCGALELERRPGRLRKTRSGCLPGPGWRTRARWPASARTARSSCPRRVTCDLRR